MRLDATEEDYLSGRRFSNAHHFPAPPSSVVPRNELLVSLAAGNRVLHVGCADHVELITEKRATGTYLHDLLARSAQQLTCTDTNAQALTEMKMLGIADLYLPEDLPARRFDLVFIPDVIEHVPNVRDFLLDLGKFGAPIVITTPNALRLQNRIRWTGELVNTDHRYWFSPYTLAKCTVDAGYRVEQLWFTDDPSKFRRLRSLLTKRFPVCSDGIAVLAIPPSQDETGNRD